MKLPFDLETRRPKQIGLIVLQEDETLEPDMRRLLPDEVECLVSRVPSGRDVTRDSLAAMEEELSAAASLLPTGARFSAIGYGCTSGTATIGAARVAAQIRAGAQTPHVSEPLSALHAACAHLGITRIGLISPYVAEVNETLRAALGAKGIAVTGFASFDIAREDVVVRIAAQSVQDAAIALAARCACEAVFLSCTNLRTLSVIAPIEAAINRPVLSSNQVLAWHLLRLAGIAAPRRDMAGRIWG